MCTNVFKFQLDKESRAKCKASVSFLLFLLLLVRKNLDSSLGINLLQVEEK